MEIGRASKEVAESAIQTTASDGMHSVMYKLIYIDDMSALFNAIFPGTGEMVSPAHDIQPCRMEDRQSHSSVLDSEGIRNNNITIRYTGR
jgi:hypothetical protein